MSTLLIALAAALLTSGSTPAVLGPGTISTIANEFGGTLTPDGSEIYYSVSVQHSYMYAIYMSRRGRDGQWTSPILAPFSGHGRDFDPVLSPDGRRLVFISDRPARPGDKKLDYDIWWVDRTANGDWSAPRRFGAPINTVAKSLQTGHFTSRAIVVAVLPAWRSGRRGW